MPTFLMPPARQRGWTNGGEPAAGCKLYTYEAGTSTPKATYQDASGTIEHENPITLDAKGEALIYWDGAYKIDLRTAAGAQITGYPVDDYTTPDIDQAANLLREELAAPTGAEQVNFLQAGSGTPRSVGEKLLDTLHAKDFGVVGDGVADDYPAFLLALSAAKTLKKPLNIADLKLYLISQNAPIDLDGVLMLQGSGKLPKPDVDIAYLNGADNAVTVWTANKTGIGTAIFSRYNGPIFTGKTFPVRELTIFADYSKPLSSAFTQSTVTTYPGWSQAISAESSFSVYYTGADGVKLAGGLELCSLRRVDIWFCGGYCLNVNMTAGINCPIEYLHIDESCSFIYGKLGCVWLNGFRRHVIFDGVLINGPGQYDVQQVANPGFTVASQTAIVPGIRVTALAAGVYGGVNHSQSTQLTVNQCYGEVLQNLVQTDGASINLVEFYANSIIPWNSAQPKNLLSIQNQVFRLRSTGNANIDGVFYLYISPSVVTSAADYLLEEATVAGGVSFVGSTPLEPALTPAPGWRPQSSSLGDGTAMTATYSVAVNQQAPNNTAAATAIWAISANFQDTQFDRNETVLMAVTRLSSGNYVGQVLIAPATTQVFSSAPSVSTAGVLQIPLTLFSRARVTRLDMQPLRLV